MSALVLITTLLVTGSPEQTAAPRRTPVMPVQAPAAGRAPLKASSRENELDLDRYFREQTVVRKRTEGKTFATFTAEPRLLDDGSVMVFEIASVAPGGEVPRWRCVATYDVAECLGTPVEIRYLPTDEEIRLTAKILPKNELENLRVASSL
jgi:hypothetical protein